MLRPWTGARAWAKGGHEPVTPDLVAGLLAVFAGIWIATTQARRT